MSLKMSSVVTNADAVAGTGFTFSKVNYVFYNVDLCLKLTFLKDVVVVISDEHGSFLDCFIPTDQPTEIRIELHQIVAIAVRVQGAPEKNHHNSYVWNYSNHAKYLA